MKNDLISRQAAIEAVVGCTNCENEDGLRAYVTKHSLENGWTGGIVDALDAIEQLPSAQPEINRSEIPNNWIPCSVRLPEDDTEVLVYLFENNKSPYIAWLSDGRWYTEYFEVEQEDEPVAWMPLPEPYQERGEQE